MSQAGQLAEHREESVGNFNLALSSDILTSPRKEAFQSKAERLFAFVADGLD